MKDDQIASKKDFKDIQRHFIGIERSTKASKGIQRPNTSTNIK